MRTESAFARADEMMTAQDRYTIAGATLRTLAAAATFHGVGLHGGQSVTAHVMPAPAGQGILFRRTDLAAGTGDIPARWDNVVDTRLCTRLGNASGASVGTVEHLMAALAGCGVTDALVLLDGPEVPIMDGSSAPFVQGMLRAGIVDSGRPARAIRILAPVSVEADGRSASLAPAERFEMSFSIDFADPAIGAARKQLRLAGSAFVTISSDAVSEILKYSGAASTDPGITKTSRSASRFQYISGSPTGHLLNR